MRRRTPWARPDGPRSRWRPIDEAVTPLRTCPSCGNLGADDARFCARCGLALGDAPPRERRALISIVFCDLVGSTALAERLDPEVLRRVQARYFEVAATALRAHGGQVEKYIGDAVMCVFGLPTAHEDDALRAARGALDLAAGVAELSADLRVEIGVELAVRIGVNTGEVVAGDPTRGQALATGDAVNTAARLQQAAPVGGILLGELTRRLVASAFRTRAVTPIVARGKTAPLAAWRLLGPVARPAGSSIATSVLVGREEELAALRARLDRVTRDAHAGLVLVSGEAGIGKSRLVSELISGLPKGRALWCACPSYGRGNTYRPLRELLDELSPIAGEREYAALLAGQADAPTIARRLLRLTGRDPGLLSRDEAFDAVARLLTSLAADRPLVVVLEDLHWAEPTLLDLLEFLDEALAVPVLLVGTARDELFEGRPDLARIALRLDRLSPETAARLLAQRHDLSAADAARVLARADGNALFLEQLARAVADGAEGVPLDIASLLAARLDRLDAESRTVLEAASIVGRDFRPGAVAALLEEGERDWLLPQLARLEIGEFVAEGRSAATLAPTGLSGLFSGRRLHFRHALVHDAVLSAMPKTLRATLHERFAGKLAQRQGHDPALVGYHLEQAARLRMELRPRTAPPPVAAAAAGELEQAGLQALARDDDTAASDLLARARALLPPTSAHRGDIETALRRSLARRSDRERE
jgi:class 3 adenylate cyclase